jgi:hypothetical protein
MKRCARCVLPETFPGISFGEDGVCSVCHDFDTRNSGGLAKHRRESLDRLIEASRSGGRGRYDAVVAFSGGKDSTFLLSVLKEQYDLRLLAVTFDNGFLSQASFSNMRKAVHALDVEHVIIRIPQSRMNAVVLSSALARVYPDHLTKFGSGVCISCIRMVMTFGLRIAIEKQVPLVMLGTSPGQLLRSEEELIYQDNKIPFALLQQLFSKLAERTGPWVYEYVMLTQKEYAADPFPYFVSPLPILGYDEGEIYRRIGALGWSKPVDVDRSSTNCRLNSFGIIRHQNLYRFHPYAYEMSQLVRLGSISRDEALERLSDSGEDVAEGVERDLMCGAQSAQCRRT